MMAARLCGVPISSHTCTGQVCLNKLLEKSFSIRLLTRSKKKIFPQGVDIFLGDLTLPDTDIEKFLIGGDVLINHAGETSNLNQM